MKRTMEERYRIDNITAMYDVKHWGYTTPCWIWNGATVTYKGLFYGKLRVSNKWMLAHRHMYILHKGEIPKGLVLDHLCERTLCCNPEHLEAVTMSVNMKRAHHRKAPVEKSKKSVEK